MLYSVYTLWYENLTSISPCKSLFESAFRICVVCKRDNRGEGAPENEDEEDLVEMETLETAMPKPKKKKNRAKQKF